MNVAEYQRMYDVEERQWWFAGMRLIADALLDGTSIPPGARILDAGCGTGRNVGHLAARGRAVGVDLSEEALRFARRRAVTVVRGDLMALPFPDQRFDLVASFDVIYHRWVSDDRAAVREMARVLRPGGLLLVRVPALNILWGAHDEAVQSRHRYTRGELRALLEAEGVDVLRATYCNTLLFPLLLLRRTLDRWTGRHGSDVTLLPAPLERAFFALLRAEAVLVRRVALPVGASVVALGRKRD